ncbi:MAG: 50S ribosomal protein L29 [Nitrospiraceae bacterium]|nr:50S ribosomal protein L29 [Nitrospiraceae bacterium]
MRPVEFRNMTADELRAKEADFRKELFNLRFQQATGEIQNPKRMPAIKKDIARLLTVLQEKEREGGK